MYKMCINKFILTFFSFDLDISSKLSNHALKVIEASKGPLKPDQLYKFFTDEKHNKKILPIIRKYSNNIDEVKNQIIDVYRNIESHMTYRKKQKELDDRLMKKIQKMNKSLEEEKEEEKELNFLKQGTLYQYFEPKSNKAINGNRKKSTKPKDLEVSEKSKNGIGIKQPEKASRKRKIPVNDEISSSQESDVTRLSSKFSKRLKLNSPQDSTELIQSSDHMSVDNTESSLSSPEPKSSSSAEGSQSSCELMSVDSTEGVQLSPKPVPCVNTEKSSRKSDAKSADGLTKTFKLTKSNKELRRKVSFRKVNQQDESSSQSADDSTEKTKSAKRSRGKVTKQQQLRLGKDASDHTGNEETVPERNLRVRK